MTKSKGTKKLRKEYLNDECESVCSEDSINYFLNPPVPKGKKNGKKNCKNYRNKSGDNNKSIKQLKYDKTKDFETIKMKIQQKNRIDPLKLYCGDDMYSFDGLDSDIMEQVISDRVTDDDSLDDEEIIDSILSDKDEDNDGQHDNDEEDLATSEQPGSGTAELEKYDSNDNIDIDNSTEDDSEYEINEIIKWKNSEDLVDTVLEDDEDHGEVLEDIEDHEEVHEDRDPVKIVEVENTITDTGFPNNQKTEDEEEEEIETIEPSAEISIENQKTYATEVEQEIIPNNAEEYNEKVNMVDHSGEENDEKCKKDEEETERNSDDKGEEESLEEESMAREETEETEDGNSNDFQKRIQFLSETIAKLKAELAEAKTAVEEEKKATKIPGHVCNMSDPCTVASQLEERLRARRDAAAATYREELQQVERMVSQEISRLEEDMSKLKPLNKLAADWELPRDAHLRSIMYRHDYMLVASDLTLNIPEELKSFFSAELKEVKTPPPLL